MQAEADGASALRLVDPWFVAEQVTSSITRIEEPHVDPLIRGNAWHVRGSDFDLLVDSGLGVASMRDFVRDLVGGEPTLVLTHAHLDHMGSAHEFRECWGHRLERYESPPRGSLLGQELSAELGLSGDLPQDLLISALPAADFDPSSYRLRPAGITRWLEDGDHVDLGDRRLTVLHLPGHTPGSIALFDERSGSLFSGDVVYDGALLDDIVGSDRAAYRESMDRLRVLDPRAVYSGHGPAFDGDRLKELIDAYLRHE